MLRRAASLVLAPALACGPSLAQLERGHHYDEAICGAAERAFPKGQVAEVIRRALDPAVHVAAVPREQLAAALGDDAPELERFVLLRITHDSNTIPLDRYFADFTLCSDRPFVRAQPDGDPNGAAVSAVRVWDDGKVVSLQPTDLLRLATVFAEHLPGPHTVQPDAIDKAIHAVGTIGAAVATIATLGLFGGLLRGRGAGPQPRTEYPTVAEIRRAAPRATRLFDAVAHLQTSCRGKPGARCQTLALVPRPPDESAELVLELHLGYGASFGSGCPLADIHEKLQIALPPGPTLEARLAAAFGDDMHRLALAPTPPTSP